VTDSEVSGSKKVQSRRWLIAWLLGLGVVVNYFDRVNLSVSHESLIAAFGITNIGFGYLSGAYNLTYAACQLPIGVLLDKFGVKRVGRIGSFLWSLATFGAAAAPTVPTLFAARFLLGVGEAPTYPASAKAIGLWFPPQSRSLATSLFDAAAKFAMATGVPLIGIVLLKVGWRWSFALTGLISLLYFLLFFKLYRDPAEDATLTPAEKQSIADAAHPPSSHSQDHALHQPESLCYLLMQRKVIGMALGFGAYNYVFYLLLTWLPSYLSQVLRVDLLHSFLYTSMPWIVATIADVAIGGWLVDVLIDRGYDPNLVRRIVLIGGTTFGLGILGAAHAHTTTQALIWITISISGLSAASPVGWSVPSLIASKNNVGRVGGIVNFSNQLSGIAAATITGYLFNAGRFAWVFGIAGIYLAIGIAAYIFLLGKIEPIPNQSI
jgi:MFS family permease